jgi:hypothetical protein
MKRILAGLLTVALMGLLIRSGLKAPGPRGTDRAPADLASESSGPLAGAESKVLALLADASSGDVSAYLAAFGPTLRERLGREAEEKGREAFAGSLRAAARARKSHAVFAPEADGPDAARVVVESVYPDRNERQTYRLERAEGGWRILDVETVRAHRPQVKFGAPATFREPEGVPVPVEIPAGGEEPPMD